MNDTVGPNGLIPTLLVFGTMPQLPLQRGRLSPYSGQEQRDVALKAALSKYQKYVSERRLHEAFRAKKSPSMYSQYRSWDKVLVYRERSGPWEGPYVVVLQEGKIVTVSFDVNTVAQRFKPFLEPEIPVVSLSSDTQQKSNICSESEKGEETFVWEDV
jgi:hypothetical protein